MGILRKLNQYLRQGAMFISIIEYKNNENKRAIYQLFLNLF